MKRLITTSAMVAALAVAPVVAMAQTTPDTSGQMGASSKMKGPPNANGASSTSTTTNMDTGTTGRSESTSGKMHGPPNANVEPGSQNSSSGR